METPEASDARAYPTCKICDCGTLTHRKIHRLSGPAVVIGYILLIPPILGIAACVILLIVILFAGAAGVAHGSVFESLSAAGLGVIALVVIGVFCFVSGLVGWLLVMKKNVLQCDICGAVVNASTAIKSHPNRSFGRASVFGFFFLFLIFIAMAVGLLHNDYRVWSEGGKSLFDWGEFAALWHIRTTAEPAQSAAMQPFTSAEGHFSVLFPASPQQLKEPPESHVHGFSSSPDKGRTVYVVEYADLRPDIGPDAVPQAILTMKEKIEIGNRPLINDKIIDLRGAPGRAFETVDPSGTNAIMQEFFAWPRLYTLMAIAQKGYTATQADQFMSSFRILERTPQKATDAEQAQPTAINPAAESAQSQQTQPAETGWKTYEADNGQQFRVNLSSVLHLNTGWAQVFVYEVGNYVPQNMMFDCHGDYILNGTGNEENWMPVPSRSVLAQIEVDVCAKP